MCKEDKPRGITTNKQTAIHIFAWWVIIIQDILWDEVCE